MMIMMLLITISITIFKARNYNCKQIHPFIFTVVVQKDGLQV